MKQGLLDRFGQEGLRLGRQAMPTVSDAAGNAAGLVESHDIGMRENAALDQCIGQGPSETPHWL